MKDVQRRVIVPLEISPTPPALGAVVHTLQGQAMGTGWCVKFSGPRQVDGTRVRAAIEGELAGVVSEMSPWEPHSDISRFNRSAPATWVALPGAFRQVLGCALQVARCSGGAFDPCVGELVDLWGFGPPGRAAAAPAPTAITSALQRAGWQRLYLDVHGRAHQPGGLQMDLSAIAKGFGVDRVGLALQQMGFENHLVEVGGELRGSGIRPDGQPWWVDLQAPPGASGLTPTRIALHGLSVATSGDYLRCFTDEAGVLRSHTIDPRSGWPVAHGLASVSVLHPDCMWADAWSTALTVLGPREGLALATQQGLAALFVERGEARWVETLTPALQALADA